MFIMLFLKFNKNTNDYINKKSIHSTTLNYFPAVDTSVSQISETQSEIIEEVNDYKTTVINEIASASQTVSMPANDINDRITDLNRRFDALHSFDDTTIKSQILQIKILTEQSENNIKEILNHLKNSKQDAIINNVLFQDSDEGKIVLKSCVKLINYIKDNSPNKLPLINKSDVLDKETVDTFNTLEINNNIITKYLDKIKDCSEDSLSPSLLKEISKPVVDSLLHYSFYNNQRFRSFIESNMNSFEGSIELFPTIFTYVIQSYGNVSYQSFCTTLLTSIGLFSAIPSFVENISAHSTYMELVEQDKQEVCKRLENTLNDHNKSLEELESKKFFHSCNLWIKSSLGLISVHSKPIIAGVSFLSVCGFLYKNPQLIIDLKQTLFTLSGYDLSSVDKKVLVSETNVSQVDVKQVESGFTHPVRRLDRTYLFFRAVVIKFFGDPDR